MRTLSSLDQYIASAEADGLRIHQYATGTYTVRIGEETLSVDVSTDYPRSGSVRLRVLEAPSVPASLSLRIPAWADSAQLDTGKGPQEIAHTGTPRIHRLFKAGEEILLELDLSARFVRAPHRVDASRGTVALERGPLVYALEQVDQDDSAVVDDALVDPSSPVVEQPLDDLDGVVALDVRGAAAAPPTALSAGDDDWPYTPWAPTAPPAADRHWRAIPYYAWANRGTGPMRVWLPELGGA